MSFRTIHRLVFVAGLVGLLALMIWPFHNWVLRYGLFASFAAAWLAGLGYLWHRKIWWTLLLVSPLLAAVPFLLPAKPLHPTRLRERYLAAMRGMEGARYLWGGERHWAIDCSGLPRRALRDALWAEGCENANGAAFRDWAEQWWFDTSAKALGENYRGFTHPTGIRGKLRDLDPAALVRGDMAVTADGQHVMVYLGNSEWIQADPGPFKVTIGKPGTHPNYFFDKEVRMQRWAVLD